MRVASLKGSDVTQQQAEPGPKGEEIENPEFGMKDLTEKLEQMEQEQRDRLPEGGDAEQAGQRQSQSGGS